MLKKKIKLFFKKNKSAIKISLFILWITLHIILLLHHEPWRDEARAWILAKNLSIKDLFITSKFDGHPILWHLILMPFAKLGFPYITIQIINLIICTIAAYIFYFKIKINDIAKTLILFGAPFIYVYPVIARNYSLALLFIILISLFYTSRFKHPYIYTILICLLLNTPTITYGFALALYTSFNFLEIINYFKKKNKLKVKKIIITNFIFILSLVIITLELFGTSNPDYPKPFSFNNLIIYNIPFAIEILFSIVLFGIIAKKDNFKIYLIAITGLIYQLFVTFFYYPALLELREFYQCVIWLFFIITYSDNNKVFKNISIIIFLIFYFPRTIISYNMAINDTKYNYSSAKETANWINKNLKKDKILIEDSIFCQSIVPYLDNIKVYDIYYEKDFEKLKIYSDKKKPKKINIDQYKGNYIILYHQNKKKINSNNLVKMYNSNLSIMNENFTIYYIKK